MCAAPNSSADPNMIHEPIRYDESSRNATLDRMIGYGANISETEKQEVIDYLICFHP